ncbi:MAG: folylpolyglutamate synthase/dihydrofolate synthase family protein [Clostridia bacterium]|nr:folylpolyglutamate synthase/dihydrofolate synthase family protein [Clostridia bacterium]
MTEQEAIAKIHSVYPTGKKNGVENMRALMARLGNIHSTLNIVHVAGTNGKGSCCAMIERMLRAAGYKTGLYTSPYIERYNERIRLNGVPIDGEKLAALVERVFPAVEACQKDGVMVTEFELGTALALAAFWQEKVDVAIVEVGLGGRLDPTNIVRPLVSVITEVGMDHMEYLGSTIEEIALEKAGIMKRGVPVVLAPQEKAARGVLLAAAKGLDIPVITPSPENVTQTSRDVTFDARIGGKTIKGLTVGLRGCHQAENACAALGAVEALRARGFDVPSGAVREGLRDVRWPGRLEAFGHVLLDGAHNDPGVRALCAYCDAWLPKERTVLLTGMLADKETEKMAERLSSRVRCAVCMTPKNPRALKAEALAETLRRRGLSAWAEPDARHALACARSLAGPEGTVLAAGSLYMIGELRTILRGEKEFAHVI